MWNSSSLVCSWTQFSFTQKKCGEGTFRPLHNDNQSAVGGGKRKVSFQSAVLSFSKMLV